MGYVKGPPRVFAGGKPSEGPDVVGEEALEELERVWASEPDDGAGGEWASHGAGIVEGLVR